MGTLYEARDLIKRYGDRTALALERLRLEERGCSALVGPNGAGKTTLLELLAGLAEPTSGTLVYRGRPVPSPPAGFLAREVTLTLQHPYLFRGTVRRNVEYGLRARRLPRREVARRAERQLAALGLLELAGRDARSLSGGEAQRVSIARALALETPVVLMDEPLAHVDAEHRRLIVDAIRELRDEGRTVVLATHGLDGLESVVDRVVALENGRCPGACP